VEGTWQSENNLSGSIITGYKNRRESSIKERREGGRLQKPGYKNGLGTRFKFQWGGQKKGIKTEKGKGQRLKKGGKQNYIKKEGEKGTSYQP